MADLARFTERSRFILNAMQLAIATLAIDASEFDRNGYLLNAQNGTVNLRTGKLRPHRAEDHLAKIVPVEYHASATSPQWLKFLNDVFEGNKETISFMRRAIGYSLVEDSPEQVYFILHGEGSNGKSTITETLRSMLGSDFSCAAPIETLTDRNSKSNTNDIRRLRGMRLVTSYEPNEECVIDEALLKQVTGEDTIAARALYREYEEFVCRFKLWIATSYKPVIHGTSDAIWRPTILIPMTVRFEGKHRDNGLKNRLLDELPGILAWGR